ncbi:hypothetical protein B484DRAFT_286477 [Ochromonadaceae sp. CCMP2298]|nr:hypothetical protein B484DRAFT_286477 [Ochromonadaceae sp. CCMP2298]
MPSFQELAAHIRQGVALFPETVRFIAEPGRYFATASTTIVNRVYSRKGGSNPYQALYCDDGVYGSFNNVVYDHVTDLLPIPLHLLAHTHTDTHTVEQDTHAVIPLIPTAVFGPTCDGLDQMCTLETTLLPRCEVGVLTLVYCYASILLYYYILTLL